MSIPLPVPIRPRRLAGMTLIEILAVIAVIVILFSLLMGLSGSTATKGDIARVRKDLAAMESALDEERIATGRYPAVDRFEGILRDSARALRWEDPWGGVYAQHYFPSANRMSYVLGSPGPNGKMGKAFFDDDILSNTRKD